MTDEQIKQIATRYQRTMCSVAPDYIIVTFEDAIKEALKTSSNVPVLSSLPKICLDDDDFLNEENIAVI